MIKKDKMCICNTQEEWDDVLNKIGNPEKLKYNIYKKGQCIHIGEGHSHYGKWCTSRSCWPDVEAITAAEFLHGQLIDDYSITF